jgi:hypothetical protein
MLPKTYHQVLIHCEASFRHFFSILTDEDMHTLLAGSPAALLMVLEQRYGYAAPQAKAAWNEFILRYVDGNTPGGATVVEPSTPPHAVYCPTQHRSVDGQGSAPSADSWSLDPLFCALSNRDQRPFYTLSQLHRCRHLC